jgi:hypothetical protein
VKKRDPRYFDKLSVGSRAGAPTLGSGGVSIAFAVGLSPTPIAYVSSSRRLARNVRVSPITRSCTVLIKGYGTYHTGAAFDAGGRDRRYPLKSPTRSYIQRLLHRFQPKP